MDRVGCNLERPQRRRLRRLGHHGGAFGSSDYNVVGSPPTITPGTTGIKTATVTALVQEWVNQGKANNGLVHLATGTNAADVKYASREDPDLADKPQITVNWTLPPSLGATTRSS